MTNTIRVFIIEPNSRTRAEEIPNTLEAMQKIVGGYIEVVRYKGMSPMLIVCNEEGKLMGLPRNRWDLVGTIFICREDGEEFASLTDDDITKLKGMVR